MAKSKLIPCHDCGKEVSKNAKTCPHCGTKLKRKAGLLGTLVVLFIAFSIFASMINGDGTTGGLINPAPSVSASAPMVLEVETFNCGHEHGYTVTEGRVKNISDKPLKNVEAVVENLAADGTFISADTAIIEYNPVMPGQSSPFKVMGNHNPLMKSCTLSFKSLMGGALGTIQK